MTALGHPPVAHRAMWSPPLPATQRVYCVQQEQGDLDLRPGSVNNSLCNPGKVTSPFWTCFLISKIRERDQVTPKALEQPPAHLPPTSSPKI